MAGIRIMGIKVKPFGIQGRSKADGSMATVHSDHLRTAPERFLLSLLPMACFLQYQH